MKALMLNEGLPYNARTHTYNSRLAQEIGAWAQSIDNNTSIHDKFFEAYFVLFYDIFCFYFLFVSSSF